MSNSKDYGAIRKMNGTAFDSLNDHLNIEICDLDLDKTEAEILKTKFDGWSTKFILKVKSLGIAGLIDDYRRLVYSCRDEKSYFGKYQVEGSSEHWRYGPGISYEFSNYVSCRTGLQIIIDSISETKKTRIMNEIQSLDVILKTLVDKNDRILYNNRDDRYPEDRYWWYYKLPYNVME